MIDFIVVPWKLLNKVKAFYTYVFVSMIVNLLPVLFIVYDGKVKDLLESISLFICASSVLTLVTGNTILNLIVRHYTESDDHFFRKKMICMFLSICLIVLIFSIIRNGEYFWIQILIYIVAYFLDLIFCLYSHMDLFPDFVKKYGDKSYDEEEKERRKKIIDKVQGTKIESDDEGCKL